MMQFILLEVWKWHTVLLIIHTGSSNMKISECLVDNAEDWKKELDDLYGRDKI